MSLPTAGALREGHVVQAVNFLQDPRVRREPMVRAVHFLRGKNVSDAEVREAFSRLKLPYPEAEAAAAVPWGYTHEAPPPPQSAFMGTMMTLGLAAGALYAAREFLRVYVIPKYFPEFVPGAAAESRGASLVETGDNGMMSTRQHNAMMEMQERQIESLKSTVEQLRRAACTTNERVERLSVTLSTASQVAERRQQETAEIRDAIRELSRTVSASNTPNTNTATNNNNNNNRIDYDRARSKDGSLAYHGGHSTAITIDESQILRTPQTDEKSMKMSENSLFKTPLMSAPNTEQRNNNNNTSITIPGAAPSTHVDKIMSNIPQVEDAFLSVAPAEIETHWTANNHSHNDNSNKVSEKRHSIASDKVSSNTASISSSANNNNNEEQIISSSRSEMLNTTRRLFEKSIKMNNIKKKNNTTNENEDDNISRRSTKSAPDPETPLTDDDIVDDIVDDGF